MISVKPGRLDYTICIPEHLFLSPCNRADRLHPTKDQPYAEYDDRVWKTRITYQKTTASKVPAAQGPLKTLDQVCEEELRRRFPNYSLIQGIPAFCKNTFQLLSKNILGKEKFHQYLTQEEVDQFKKQISFSAINRKDLLCQPAIEDPGLRSSLQLKDDSLLQTHHIFAKNSPLNGIRFDRDGKTVELTRALASTSDRTVENTGNLRIVTTKSKESICYAGRPDTDRKALEQATFIFLNEIKTARKGITETKDSDGTIVYQLDYAVNSLLSAPWVWYYELPFCSIPERELIENERAALQNLKNRETIAIEDPDSGKTYQVKFNPILFTRSMNFLNRFEQWLPPIATGAARSEEISEEGYSSLLALAPPSQAVQELEKHRKEGHLLPEEEILIRDYLCKTLSMPVIYHCKSSLDRTSIPVAISSALQQWIDLKLPIPQEIRLLLQDARFKELFAANLMAGHQISRYACNRKGTLAGEKPKEKTLGLTFNTGIFQIPSVTRLLPERYLKEYPKKDKIEGIVFYFFSFAIFFFFIYLPLTFLSPSKNRDWSVVKAPFKMLVNYLKLFPDKVLNEDSPLVKERSLIKDH